MTADQQQRGTPGGARSQALIEQLRWVHEMLRRDLTSVRGLAARVVDGASVSEVQAGLRDLQRNGPLFQLRVNCLSYCQTLHSHHRNEDAILFPAVRRAAPQLKDAVDRLEADHRLVAARLDRLEALMQDLSDIAARQALVEVLTELSTDLLQHLEFEEQALAPVLNAWDDWPEQRSAERAAADHS